MTLNEKLNYISEMENKGYHPDTIQAIIESYDRENLVEIDDFDKFLDEISSEVEDEDDTEN